VQTQSCGRKKKLRASSRCTMATIALRNRPSRNCRLRLPKRENLPQPRRRNLVQQLGESHAPPERRERKSARWRDDLCMILRSTETLFSVLLDKSRP
jgi:hypothetical protein